MSARNLTYIGISILIAMFLLALYFYPLMPIEMAVHFNFQGLPDRYMHRFFGIFLLPFISLLLYLFFYAILRIDPLRKNIEEFRLYYEIFIVIFLLFMFYIEFSLVFWNVGIRLNIMRFLTIPMGLFYVYIGVLLGKSKRNWFVGVRTPWTLDSDYVWNKTNKLAGKFFIIDGVFVMLSFFFAKFILVFVLWLVLFAMLIIMLYSYVIWAKTKKEEE